MAWSWGGAGGGAVSGATMGTAAMPGWGTAIGGILGAGGGGLLLDGGEANSADQVALAPYYEDPYYSKAQGELFPFYSSLLAGKPNNYYAPIGEVGGSELDKILNLTNRDITTGVNENLVRRGMSRSGVGADAISRAVGDNTAKLRWEDFNRAMTGRLNLLNIGSTGMSGVRSAALTNQGMKNQYNLGAGSFDLGILQNQQAQDDSESAMWGSILGSGVSAATNMYGYGKLADAMKMNTAPKTVTGDFDIEALLNRDRSPYAGIRMNLPSAYNIY